ncbi:uncharacterized protein LOC126792556 [Argentina anserina]|uniref:uncharacterized protein LOC126792556 n=1 Tax=Argentina anserina TaxID=57926 RepID=UPI0021768484|nr:uncharacterized protein LOC126792556 [Potentilla anserina]
MDRSFNSYSVNECDDDILVGHLYSGIPMWFVIFGISLCVICICYCCRRKKPYGYSRTAYCLSLVTLIIFTLVAIAGCVVLYTGQGLFYTNTRKTLDYLVNEADETAENLRNVSDYLSASKKIGLAAIVLPTDIQKKIDDGMGKVKNVANVLSDTTEKTAKKSCITSLSMCGMRLLVYCLVIVGWILVTCTFILCGAFLLIHNVFGYACVSMDEWVQKQPTAHTSLDDFLPCVDKDVAQGILDDTKMATYYAVYVVNRFITDGANGDPSAGGIAVDYNQSGDLLPLVCNPLNEDKTDRKCAPGEIEMQQASEEWGKYMCKVSSAGQCESPGRLTPTYFDQISAFVNVSYALHRYGPFFADLADCTFVKDTFSDISKQHCPGLVLHSRWIYIGLLMLEHLVVMLSMIFWVIYCRERRHHYYTKKSDSILNESANFGSANQDSKNVGSRNLGSANHGSRNLASASNGSSHYGSVNNGYEELEFTHSMKILLGDLGIQ